MPLIFLILGVAAIGLFFSIKAQAAPVDTVMVENNDTQQAIVKHPGIVPFQDIFEKYGTQYDIDWQLIAAHAYAESRFNPAAKNAEGSSGLMQILLPLYKNGAPHNKGAVRQLEAGNIPEWENIDPKKLFDSDYNVMLGASLIRANLNSYGLDAGISRYNSDSAGNYVPFKNQSYVDAVKQKYQQLVEESQA